MKKIFLYLLISLPLFLSAQEIRVYAPKPAGFNAANRPKNLSDSALLDYVQQQTFKYFWDFAYPGSYMARESNYSTPDYGDNLVTTGGTGFGIMAMIVAAERKWQPRDSAAARLLKMVNFLIKAQAYHGVYPHWMDGATGKTIPFSRRDDGADIVETSYLMQGLLCARQYFTADNFTEKELRQRITWLWEETNWNWHTKNNSDLLYWHWSPNYDWDMNFEMHGYNETLITYILAASAPRYPINAEVYHTCWAKSSFFKNGKEFYGVKLPIGFDYGGPLFFSQYSFLGVNPHGLKDEYADYWQQNYNHTLINYKHCVLNPNHFKGYGENCWGLTAGDTFDGYDAYSPSNDKGTIAPTAALSAFPYTPEYSMKALKHFYYDLGDSLWGEYGFYDGFNETRNWYAKSYLAIDEGPIVVMIENYRTGLLWKLFMSCDEMQSGLKRLSFESPYVK